MLVKTITRYTLLFLISTTINTYAINLQDSVGTSQDSILTGLSIEDSLAYMAGDQGLYIFNVSNPGSPDFMRGFYLLPNESLAMDLSDGLIYVIDSFSGLVILQLEDYGFCKPGEGGPFVEDGGILWKGGRMPVNTHGGNLSEVYLLGLTHVAEAVKQLRGTSTSQVEGAEIALVTSGPTNMPSSSLLLRS